MPRILLRAPKDPFRVVSPKRALRDDLIGGDVGRLLAAQGMHRLLWTAGADVRTTASIEGRRADRDVDHVVLPLGAAIGPSAGQHLDRLARAIEALRVPVTVVGLGARLPLSGSTDRLDAVRPSVVRLLRAVLDRSAAIGVAGELTESYLRSLGFHDVQVTGDPAMWFRDPPAIRRPRPIGAGSRIALALDSGTTALDGFATREAARYPRLRHVAQSRRSLQRLLAGDAMPLPAERTGLFLDPTPWVAHLRDYDLAVGSRFSGIAAALLAGTPASVLAADGAALEAARWAGVPVRTVHRVTERTGAAGLLAEGDWSDYRTRLPQRREAMRAFLAGQGLGSVLEPGEDGVRFDRRAAETAYPGDVSGRSRARAAVRLPGRSAPGEQRAAA